MWSFCICILFAASYRFVSLLFGMCGGRRATTIRIRNFIIFVCAHNLIFAYVAIACGGSGYWRREYHHLHHLHHLQHLNHLNPLHHLHHQHRSGGGPPSNPPTPPPSLMLYYIYVFTNMLRAARFDIYRTKTNKSEQHNGMNKGGPTSYMFSFRTRTKYMQQSQAEVAAVRNFISSFVFQLANGCLACVQHENLSSLFCTFVKKICSFSINSDYAWINCLACNLLNSFALMFLVSAIAILLLCLFFFGLPFAFATSPGFAVWQMATQTQFELNLLR